MKDEREIQYAVADIRVSSLKQEMTGDSPEEQLEQIKIRAEQLGTLLNCRIEIRKIFEFTESASGELDTQPVLKAIEYCKNPANKIRFFFTKSIDRFTRGGSTIYGLLKTQLSKLGIQLVDVMGIIGTQKINTLAHLNVRYDWSEFSPTWITELLDAERAREEVRTILTRLIGAEIRYVRMGYHVRQAPMGFRNQKIETERGMRVILEGDPTEAPWFIRMYELRIQGNLDDKEIVKEINDMGFRSRKFKRHDPNDKKKIIGFGGGNKLTVKQFQRYIQNPIYAGINDEFWTEGKPIKERFDGLVTIDMFNKANRGKIVIVENPDGTVSLLRNQKSPWGQKKLKENPLFPYRHYVLCPICRKSLLASFSRSKNGERHGYYHCGNCGRNHKYIGIPVAEFHKTIKSFVEDVKFSEEYFIRFRQIVLEEWEKREKNLSDDTINFGQRVTQIEQEIQNLKEKIKVLTSVAAIKLLEDDIDNLEQEKAQATLIRDRKEKQQVDVQVVLGYLKYYIEHPEELLFSSSEPLRNAAMFGLLFEELPTYDDLVNRTPKLARLFALKSDFKTSKSLSVTPQGFEPWF
ncbi:MAG: hypothetical protein ACOZBZ_04395 [Patescibacteria group bacterium]